MLVVNVASNVHHTRFKNNVKNVNVLIQPNRSLFRSVS